MSTKTITTSVAAGITAIVLFGQIAYAGEKEEAKKDDYPLSTCVVSGDKLDAMGEPYVYEIKFCCRDCVNSFLKNPKKYLVKLENARKEKSSAKPESEEQGGSHGKSDADSHGKKHDGHEHGH